LALNSSSLEDSTIIDVDEYDDASDGGVPMFVKHTEAILDEVDRMVCLSSYPYFLSAEMGLKIYF
jgi:hypothetical protein